MLAWAGLTLGAPYQRVDNTELVVNKVSDSKTNRPEQLGPRTRALGSQSPPDRTMGPNRLKPANTN